MIPSEELQREVRQLYTLLHRAGVEDQTALTATQRLAIVEIADAGALRLHELAERMDTTPPTASRAVDALVAARLVRRIADPHDRRAVQIELTPLGRRHVDQRRARVASLLTPALLRLSEQDAVQLVELLSLLNDELRDVAARDAA